MQSIKDFEKRLIFKDILIHFELHHNQTLNSLNDYLINISKYHLYDYEIKKIIDLLLYDFSNYDITNRLNQIKLLKKDSNSKTSFLLRYGEDEGNKRYKERLARQKITSSKSYIFNKFGEERGSLILKSKCPNNLVTLTEKYGEKEGKTKYIIYKKHYSHGNSLKGYIEKYGNERGELLYNERQKKYDYVNSKQYYIDKFGNENGVKKWNNKNNKISYKSSKQYYIDAFGKERGEILFKENTLYSRIKKKYGDEWFKKFLELKHKRASSPIKQKFISKYGDEEGLIKYNEYITKQKYAHTIEYYIDKYGENAEYEYLKSRQRLLLNLLNKKNASNISKELFINLQKMVNNVCKFMGNNKEFFIYDVHTKRLYFYDFFYKNKIIEFNGDFWHMNPMFYNENDVNKKTRITASEIWEHDLYKLNLAKNFGYKVKIVWESDYKNNKEQIINECLNFLQNE